MGRRNTTFMFAGKGTFYATGCDPLEGNLLHLHAMACAALENREVPGSGFLCT